MSYPTSPFVVIADGHEVGDLPTPALIQNGGGEAYQMEGGAWRLRDDKYDEAQAIEAAIKSELGVSEWRSFLPKYTRVRVERRRECPGAKTAWNIPHFVEYGAELYGSRHQCYDDATYDGVPTGDELSKMGGALARMEAGR